MTSPSSGSHSSVLLGSQIAKGIGLRRATFPHSSPWQCWWVDGRVDVARGRVCSSAPARLEVFQSTHCRMRQYCSSSVVFTPSDTCLGEPRRPNITRDGSGSGITGSMAIGVNKANTIWCRARAMVEFMSTNVLSALFWQYSNGARLPAVDRGQSSGHDVYMERYAGGGSVNRATWFRALRFQTTPPSVAGN